MMDLNINTKEAIAMDHINLDLLISYVTGSLDNDLIIDKIWLGILSNSKLLEDLVMLISINRYLNE